MAALVEPEMLANADEHDLIALRVLDRHLTFRFEEQEHEALEEIDGEKCGVFLTPKHVQRLLREIGAPRRGEKYAREVLSRLITLGALKDTRQVKKPRRPKRRIAAAEKFQPTPGVVASEGGRDSQPTSQRSYWWRVFRVNSLENVLAAYARTRGAYASCPDCATREFAAAPETEAKPRTQ